MRANHIPLLAAIAAMVGGSSTWAQVPYPPHVIQGVSWSSGTHHTAVTNKILSPGVASHPVSITGTADAEFVSATEVRLTDGFHAGGFSGNGRFHARIDEALGDPADLVVIAPKPATHVIDNILHVEKWEKLEIGLKLPQEYQDAIDRFFDNYYPDAPVDYTSDPSNTDAVHDLNPYADDSLQLVMMLTDPSGDPRMKWGFFMREGRWASSSALAPLAEDLIDPLHPYHIRFRFAPDEEGTWQISLTIKAPYTNTPTNDPLPDLLHTGYQFISDPPLPDNNGYLQVNGNNHRVLQFEGDKDIAGDETPFFGLGPNLPDVSHGDLSLTDPPDGHWYTFYQRDFEEFKKTMERLHSVGGTFMRVFLMRNIFAPEWVNHGVYDHYKTPEVCDTSFPTPCENQGWTNNNNTSNCQWQSWAFDQVLDHARANNLYLQLCVDPYFPGVDYEKFLWGAHPYVVNFLDPDRPDPPALPYDMNEFFYRDGDPMNKGDGVFYYWKRKYKYLMARWGYSVNIASIEPFNEIDQMLSYQDRNMIPDPGATCEELAQLPYWANCMENRVHWLEDDDLPGTISDWLTDIITYVRYPVDPFDPVGSPLGEDRKLFLMSYTDAEDAASTDPEHYLPFENEHVDLLDVHRGLYSAEDELWSSFDESQDYRDTYQSGGTKKPFSRGEHSYFEHKDLDPDIPGAEYETWKVFHNYDVSFHNELWASTFYGNFAAGTTWNTSRVFWFPDAMNVPPSDVNNPYPPNPLDQFSNVLGDVNLLNIGIGTGFSVENRSVFHNLKPLSDFMAIVQALGLFNADYNSHGFVLDPWARDFECYYLMNEDQDLALGWVHNMKAYWENSFYITSAVQDFLGCTVPPSDPPPIEITGFTSDDYFVTWFPTRMNTIICPADYQVAGSLGMVPLIFDADDFNAISNNYIDTLHSDYAFIISTSQIPKSLTIPAAVDTAFAEAGWDFILYPNPARDELFVQLPDDQPRRIVLHDLTGRQIRSWESAKGPVLRIPVEQLARGPYALRVSGGSTSKTKKFIIR